MARANHSATTCEFENPAVTFDNSATEFPHIVAIETEISFPIMIYRKSDAASIFSTPLTGSRGFFSTRQLILVDKISSSESSLVPKKHPAMTRKGEQTAKRNERDYPHVVEIAIPDGGLGNRLNEMLHEHKALGIQERRGPGRYDTSEARHYGRWCFTDRQNAELFARVFGGKVISS